jgi:hypothetical protein
MSSTHYCLYRLKYHPCSPSLPSLVTLTDRRLQSANSDLPRLFSQTYYELRTRRRLL